MSIRLAVVSAEGDRHEAALGDDLSRLPLDERLAVELADELMTNPAGIAPALVAALHAVFTREQLIEICLKVMKFNVQKVSVAFGTDAAVTTASIASMRWNQSGEWVVAST